MAEKQLRNIDAPSAAALRDKGAVFVDIREPNEHAAERIPNSLSVPMSSLGAAQKVKGNPVVFYCRSGARTQMAAPKLMNLFDGQAYILTGGLGMWKTHGLPVEDGGAGAQSGAFLFEKVLNIFGRKP